MNVGTIYRDVGEIQYQLAHHCPYVFYMHSQIKSHFVVSRIDWAFVAKIYVCVREGERHL